MLQMATLSSGLMALDQSPGKMENGAGMSDELPRRNAGRVCPDVAKASSQAGDCSSGMGLA
jgi:hypothetical protein